MRLAARNAHPQTADSVPVRKTIFSDADDTLTIAAAGEQPADAVEDAHHAYLVTRWASLAAAAYEGFQRFGIGAVVIEAPRETGISVPNPFLAASLHFAPAFGAWLRSQPDSAARRWVEREAQTYDVRTSGLFLFLQPGAPPRAYTVEGTLTPPEAFARVKALLN